LPSIGRYSHIVQGYEDWRVLHDDLIERFLRLGHPFLTKDRSAGVEAWVVAQHHGLPTRLLDTTTNPLKALFFAVNHPAEDSHDGVLWVASYSGWFHDLNEGSPSLKDDLVAFLPAQLTPRLTAQEGAFISYPLPNNCKPLRPIECFEQKDISLVMLVVPRTKKAALRVELDRLGIQFRLLFPDLEGVARSIKLTELRS